MMGQWLIFLLSVLWFLHGAVFEPEAVIAGLEDVAMVGQAVEEGGGHLGVPEYLMMPLILIGESLMFRLLTPIILFLGPVYG